MINYIIINGTNSNTINGLGINELPPISKPPLRVQTDTIDGRDGDITTNLGYGAYDKTITIGLFGTGYDINEVISFFNGEGTVVFSNEPDKYYKYKIIEQIDYEALLKFKSATITFHCQPFKYPLEETPIEIEYEYIEQDDVESATLNNTNDGTSLDISLKGNTSQYTTTGKNLLDTSKVVRGSIGSGGNYTDTGTTSITINGNEVEVTTTTEYRGFVSDYIEVEENKIYALSYDKPTSGVTYFGYFNWYDTNKDFISRGGSGTGAKTSPANTKYVRIFIGILTAGTFKTSNIQLEQNSSATSFEPYTNGASPNPDYPQPINVVSGDNTIKVEGKNVVKNINDTRTNNGITFTPNNDGTFTMNGTRPSGNGYVVVSIGNSTTLKPGNYTFYVETDKLKNDNSLNIRLRDTNNNAAFDVSLSNAYKKVQNKTLTEETTIDSIGSWFNANDSITNAKIKMMIVPGTYTLETIGDFEPYTSQTYPISLGTLELCKINTYQDYFYKTDKWYLHKEIGKVVLDGSERDNLSIIYTSSTRTSIKLSNVPNAYGSDNQAIYDIYSNRFTKNRQAVIYGAQAVGVAILGSARAIYFCIEQVFSNVSAVETWLSTNNTIVYYPLATPTNTEITDTTLITQLDNIKNAISYEGQTNVSQENNDKPFLLDLIAMKKGTDEVVINNIGNTYSKPTIALEGTGETDIYLNNTEILQVDLTDTNTITIDTANMEAINPTDNTLANRKVIGNYNSMTLPSGNTTMKITGALDKATITDYTRYL